MEQERRKRDYTTPPMNRTMSRVPPGAPRKTEEEIPQLKMQNLQLEEKEEEELQFPMD